MDNQQETPDTPEEEKAGQSTPHKFVMSPENLVDGSEEGQLERLDQARAAEQNDDEKDQRSFARKVYEATVEPAARGIQTGIDETSDAVVGLGAAIVNQFVKRGVGTESYRSDFLNWYQERDLYNPLKIGDEFQDKYLGGPSDTLAESIVEKGVQFGISFLLSGKLLAITKIGKLAPAAKAGTSLKTLLGGQEAGAFRSVLQGITAETGKKAAVRAALKLSLKELAFETVRGGLADFVAFDGAEGRLADLMEEHEFLRNPIQQFLASDEQDSDFEGRMKNLLEGMMLGSTIDIFIGGIRGIRAWRRATAAIKAGDKVVMEGALDEMVEIVEQEARIREATIKELREVPDGERVAVVDNEDGTASLLVRLSEEERTEAARFADSGEIGRVGLENHDSAVIDPNSGFMGRGTTHEEARRAIAADRLGLDIESDEVSKLTETLMDAIPGDMEGFIEKGAPDSAFETRAATHERLARQTAEGHSEMQFASRVEAEEVGAALEMVEQARLMQRGPDAHGFDPVTSEAWAAEAIRIEEAFKAGDKETIFKIHAESSVNLRYIYNGQRAKSALAALAQLYPEVGRRISLDFKGVKRLGGDMFDADINEAEMKSAMAGVFDASQDLDVSVFWMKSWMVALGNEAQKLARLVEGSKTQAARDIQLAELSRALDNMLDSQDLLTGTLSNIGRGLRAAAINVQPRKISRAGRGALAEVKATVEGLGEQIDQAAKAGKDTRPLDKQLQEAMDALEKIMKETTDARVGVKPKAKAAEVATEAPEVLSVAERRAALIKRANELVESEAARELKLREIEGLESPTAPLTSRVVADMTPQDLDAMVRAVFLADNGEPAQILQAILVPASRTVAEDGVRFINQPALKGAAKGAAAVQWYRVNSMLSGSLTHAVNTISNTMAAILRPVEMAVGGALHGNKESVRAAGDLLVGMTMNWADHWRATRIAMKTGQGVLDPKASHFSGSFARTQAALRGGTGQLLTRIVGTPGALLMGLDEFASQASYRGFLRMGALKEGRKLGMSGTELAEFVEAQLRFGYGADGQAINKAARNFARENTFKDELETFGKELEKAITSETVGGHVAQFLMPFRKTPINLTKFAWERTPGLNLLKTKYRRALFGTDRAAREAALGKMVVGTAMYSTAALLFLNGSLTGNGPSDPRARKAALAAGFRPNTMTIGGVTIDMKRLDPVLTPFVIMGNMMEAAGELDDETYAELASMMAVVLSETISDRAFFGGLSEFLEIATSGNPDKLDKWLENTTSTLIPNLLKQGNPDDLFREADGFVEEVLKGTVGFSNTLEPRRNLFGEPMLKPVGYGQRLINPFTMSWGSTVGEDLGRELYDLGSTMHLPSETKSFGAEGGSINLKQRGKYKSIRTNAPKKQSPYDRWIELTAGKKAGGGDSLKDNIIRITETQRWADADPTVRRNILEGRIAKSRAIAWKMLLAEFPTLGNEVRFRTKQNSIKSKVADPETLQSIRDAFGVTEEGRWARLAESINRNQ